MKRRILENKYFFLNARLLPLGENCALTANQSVDFRATTLFNIGLNSAKVWNRGFNWPVFGVRMHKKSPNVSPFKWESTLFLSVVQKSRGSMLWSCLMGTSKVLMQKCVRHATWKWKWIQEILIVFQHQLGILFCSGLQIPSAKVISTASHFYMHFCAKLFSTIENKANVLLDIPRNGDTQPHPHTGVHAEAS